MSAIIGMAGEGPPGAAPKRGRTKGSAASAAISGQPSGRPSHNCGQGSDDRVELANFCPAAAFLTPRCSHTMMMACCVRPAGNGEVAMSSTLNPARFKLDLALSEFSKARWAAEPSVDAPLQPTDLDSVASTPSSLGKQTSFALARFLITFCSGVAATLAWQSYGDAARKMIASSSLQLGWSAPQAAPEAATRAIEAGGFGFVVQLSAQRSEPEAQAAFRTMQAKYSVLSGRQPLIRRKDQGERGIFYAAQVGPFVVKRDADQLCEKLKSAGSTCFVQKN